MRRAAYRVAPVNMVLTSNNPFDQPCEVCQGELGTNFVSRNGAAQDDHTCSPFLTDGEHDDELMRCPEPGTFNGSLRLRPAGLQTGAGQDMTVVQQQDGWLWQDTITVHVEGNAIQSGRHDSIVVNKKKMDQYTEPVTQCVRGNGMPLNTTQGISIRLEEYDQLSRNDYTDSFVVNQTILERIRQTIENGTVHSVTLEAQFQFDHSSFRALLENEGLAGVAPRFIFEGMCMSALDMIPMGRVAAKVARVGSKVVRQTIHSKVVRQAYRRMAKDKDGMKDLLRKLDEGSFLEPADEAAAMVARRKEKGDSLALHLSTLGVDSAIDQIDEIMALTDHLEFCLVDVLSKGKTTYKFKYVIEPVPSELADHSCGMAEPASSSKSKSIPTLVLLAVATLHLYLVPRAGV